MKKSHLISYTLCALFSFSVASAQSVYMCGGTFTNKPGKGCSRVALKPISVIGSESPYAGSGSSSVKTTSRGGGSKPKPGVQNTSGRYPTETQTENSSRTQGRLAILQSELENERKALSQAKASLSSAKAGAEKQSLQNAVIDRQKNIEAIEKEIARAK
jgi:hypothetical protein